MQDLNVRYLYEAARPGSMRAAADHLDVAVSSSGVVNNFVNATAGFSNFSPRFSLNLFDRKYYTNAYEKAFAGGMFLNPSFRSFGVKVTVRMQ
jgi:hypothetical protein